MYIELPFGIVIASRGNVIWNHVADLRLRVLDQREEGLARRIVSLSELLRTHENRLVEKSAEIGRLEAANAYYQDQLDELRREILAHKQDKASLESRLARAERYSQLPTDEDRLENAVETDAIDAFNRKLAAAGLFDPAAKTRDPRSSMLTSDDYQPDGSAVLAQAIGNSWNLPGEDLPVQDTQGLAHDLARDEDLDY